MHSFPFLIQICVGNEIHCHGLVNVLCSPEHWKTPHSNIKTEDLRETYTYFHWSFIFFGKPFALVYHSVTTPKICLICCLRNHYKVVILQKSYFIIKYKICSAPHQWQTQRHRVKPRLSGHLGNKVVRSDMS